MWNSEAEFWSTYLSKHVRGKWRRLEAMIGDGFPDTYGLWRRQSIWVELKIGKPNKSRLEASQVDFALDCVEHAHPFFTCFGYRGRAFFYAGMDFETIVHPPWFSDTRLRR